MSQTPNPLGSLLDFSGKTALVAGVLDEHSIGWPIAKLLNDGGARVALSIQRKAVRRMLGTIPEQLNNPLILECDVSKDEQLERLFDELGKEFGRLDFLIHSVAYAPPQSFQQRFLDIGRADFQLAMDVSAYSLIGLAHGAFPLMKERGGCILAMTYYAGEKVIPGYQLMSITKAALDNGLADQIETQTLVPVKRCRTISKRDMIHNDALPDIEIDPETYNVYVDGERITVKPAKTLPLTQLFYFR